MTPRSLLATIYPHVQDISYRNGKTPYIILPMEVVHKVIDYLEDVDAAMDAVTDVLESVATRDLEQYIRNNAVSE